jgi:hypothetical protein
MLSSSVSDFMTEDAVPLRRLVRNSALRVKESDRLRQKHSENCAIPAVRAIFVDLLSDYCFFWGVFGVGQI